MKTIWAIADLHLPFGAPDKHMKVFGPVWEDYTDKIKKEWEACVSPDDLVIIAGDISWALRLDAALLDLKWIDRLPGSKVMIKGNHDYWWPSSAKLKAVLPPSISFIHLDAYTWNGVTMGGVRLWDTPEYTFHDYIEFIENPLEKKEKVPRDNEKIFVRDLGRLRLSLDQLDPKAKHRLALTHYPPVGADMAPSRTSQILEEFGISHAIFGHLHGLKPGKMFGTMRGITYHLTSADYLAFKPVKILEL